MPNSPIIDSRYRLSSNGSGPNTQSQPTDLISISSQSIELAGNLEFAPFALALVAV